MFSRDRFAQVRHIVIIALGSMLVLLVSDALAYTYTGVGGDGGWDDVEKGSSVTYVLDRSDYTQDLGLSEAQITSALNRTFETWAAAENASLDFTEMADQGGNYDLLDGTPGNWFGGYPGDSMDQGADYLYANITFGGWLDNDYFDYLEDGSIDGLPSNILGVTWSGKVRGPLSRKPRWVADIFLNDGWTWSLNGDDPTTSDVFEIDIETVMLHELGHAVGLGHEDGVPAVMNSSYGGIGRNLFQDDLDGIASLYPAGSGGGGGGGGRPPWAGGGGKDKLTILYFDESTASLREMQVSIPEPATMAMLALGGIAILRRRRR